MVSERSKFASVLFFKKSFISLSFSFSCFVLFFTGSVSLILKKSSAGEEKKKGGAKNTCYDRLIKIRSTNALIMETK